MINKPFKRNNYFSGQILTEKDLRNEQEYQNGKRRLLNRCFYGSGVICGLEVEIFGRSVLVKPGLALDCYGREIFVSEQAKMTPPSDEKPLYLLAQYDEHGSDPVPGLGESGDNGIIYSRITEGFRLSWDAENPMAQHKSRQGHWVSCEEDHPIPVARVYFAADQLLLDEKYAATIRRDIFHSD